MQRTFSTRACVVHHRRFGEKHRFVHLLSPDAGLISAAAYGSSGMKSRLRGATQPHTVGIAYLYRTPSVGGYKLTDFEAQRYHPGLSQRPYRLGSASTIAELLLCGWPGPDQAADLYTLVTDAWALLDSADAAASRRLLIQVVWRFLSISGSRPNVEEEEGIRHLTDGLTELSIRMGELVAGNRAENPVVAPGFRPYILHTERLPLENAARVSLTAEAEQNAVRVALGAAATYLGSPLRSVDAFSVAQLLT